MMRDRALAEAKAWIGTPYCHQASCRGAGTDCLGLVRGIWRALYGREPETPPAYMPDWRVSDPNETLLAAASRHLISIDRDEAAPGDVLLFRPGHRGAARHCAILSGADRMIHAYWGRSVRDTALTPWWKKRFAAAFRFPDKERAHG